MGGKNQLFMHGHSKTMQSSQNLTLSGTLSNELSIANPFIPAFSWFVTWFCQTTNHRSNLSLSYQRKKPRHFGNYVSVQIHRYTIYDRCIRSSVSVFMELCHNLGVARAVLQKALFDSLTSTLWVQTLHQSNLSLVLHDWAPNLSEGVASLICAQRRPVEPIKTWIC